jgi:hypothetical protein
MDRSSSSSSSRSSSCSSRRNSGGSRRSSSSSRSSRSGVDDAWDKFRSTREENVFELKPVLVNGRWPRETNQRHLQEGGTAYFPVGVADQESRLVLLHGQQKKNHFFAPDHVELDAFLEHLRRCSDTTTIRIFQTNRLIDADLDDEDKESSLAHLMQSIG